MENFLGKPEKVYAKVYDLSRPKQVAVNPFTTFRVESYTVNIGYTTCRICDSMRHVVVFRTETAVLQVSTYLGT